jgi:6-phosphogluconolactonase
MTNANSRTCVYVVASDSGEVFSLELDPQSGALTPLQTVPIRGGEAQGGGCPAAVSPDKRFFYVALRTAPFAVLSFAIDPGNGNLTLLGEAPLGDHMAYIATDNTGRWLLGASFPGDYLNVSPIGSDGVVQAPQPIIPTPPRTHCALTDPSNRYLFVSCRDGNVVLQNRFDATTGAVTPGPAPSVSVRPGAGPRHFRFHPSRPFVYLLNEIDASIYAFAFDEAQGTLKELQTVSALPPDFTGNPSAADLHLTPDGGLLYASLRASSTLASFRVDAATGMLTPLEIIPTVGRPRGFNINPSGRYMLVAGQTSNSVASYAIDPKTGGLSQIGEYPMGKGPNWVEIITMS